MRVGDSQSLPLELISVLTASVFHQLTPTSVLTVQAWGDTQKTPSTRRNPVPTLAKQRISTAGWARRCTAKSPSISNLITGTTRRGCVEHLTSTCGMGNVGGRKLAWQINFQQAQRKSRNKVALRYVWPTPDGKLQALSSITL